MTGVSHYQQQLARTLQERTGFTWSLQKSETGCIYRSVAMLRDVQALRARYDGFFKPYLKVGAVDERGIVTLSMTASDATACLQQFAGRVLRAQATMLSQAPARS